MSDKNLAATLLRALVLVIVVAIVTVASFGFGVTVGARFPMASALQGRLRLPASSSGVAAAPAAAAGTATPAGQVVDPAFLSEVWGVLQNQFYGDLPQGKDATYAAVKGIVASLGDPHTAFLEPKSAEMFNTDIQGQFEGIGARVDLAPGGGVLITYLFPGQPAEKAGIVVGDVVTAVDGVDVTRMSLTDAVSRIRGPNGSKAVLTIEREGRAPVDIAVVRASIEIPVVTSKSLEDGKIAYIALSEFSSVATGRLSDALNKAMPQKPAGLVLDLRGNPGGLLDQAVKIGSMFVPDGSILLERSKDGSEREYAREGRFMLGKTPLVVLVDSGSASASEIVAGAIQDAGTGVLIGEQTYGKGSVQLPNTLSDGSQLRVTIAHWFTPKDRAIDKVGLAPDYVVKITRADAEARRDPQLDAAVKYLLGDRAGLQTPTPGVTRSPIQPAATGTPAPGK